MERKVKKLHYNWRQSGNVVSGIGEDYDLFEVGKNNVIEIMEAWPNNSGGLWVYTIKFKDENIVRIFNPNYVEYFKTMDEFFKATEDLYK